MTSLAGGFLTSQAGYLHAHAESAARWWKRGLGWRWRLVQPSWVDAADAEAYLQPSVPLSRYAFIPRGEDWVLILSNGPNGTDLGVLPSHAARELACTAARVVCVPDDVDEGYPARILELYTPQGEDPGPEGRSIVAMNDGGRWVFETSGQPLSFEDQRGYESPRVKDRLTPDLLFEYLRRLHVPLEAEPRWDTAVVVEQRPRMLL